MLTLFKWMLYITLASVLITFSIANRTIIDVSLYPLPIVFNIPIYIFSYILLAIGVLIGGLITYVTALKWHNKAWKQQRKLDRLEKELETHKNQETEEKLKALPSR